MKIQNIKFLNSNSVIALVFVVVTWINFNQERWLKLEVISNDVNHYYSYLPALLYKNDLRLNFLSDGLNTTEEQRYFAPNKTAEGKSVIKMTSGMAIGFLPFFALAHLYSDLAGLPTTGFTIPYHFAIQFSTLFYFIVGLIFLKNLLGRFANKNIVALSVFLISFGTNVFYYLTIKAGNVHTFTFFLNAGFIYFSFQWYHSRHLKSMLLAVVFLALSTLTRPTNGLFIILPIFYNVLSLKDFVANVKSLWSYKTQILISIIFFILIMLPQLLYWKMVSGELVFNSYIKERFYFSNPHIIDGLFSFRKGWLLYTPIMIFSLIGIFYLRKNLSSYLMPLSIFVPVYLYVTFSWWCWWYGGSFGQRPLIDIYPLLCIPLCAFISKIHATTPALKMSTYCLIGLLVGLNLFQTMQAKYNIIHYDSMSRENYFRVFLTHTGKPDREKYLKHPDYEKALKGEDEY